MEEDDGRCLEPVPVLEEEREENGPAGTVYNNNVCVIAEGGRARG